MHRGNVTDVQTDVVLPDEVEGLLLVETEEPSPIPIEVVAFALTLLICVPLPVSTLTA